jgi:hypothetical protein
MEKVTTIVTTKRPDDWHVCIEGYPEIWECGPSEEYAIGRLIKYRGEYIEGLALKSSAPGTSLLLEMKLPSGSIYWYDPESGMLFRDKEGRSYIQIKWLPDGDIREFLILSREIQARYKNITK